MSEASNVSISVAPNGARKTTQDHPNMPITPEALALEATRCAEAGAVMMHVHVRDEQQNHSLDIVRYRHAMDAIESVVGDQLVIQATSESGGIYTPRQQMALVKELKPQAVSLAVRELFTNKEDEVKVGDFLQWVVGHSIAPQYILHTPEDVAYYCTLVKQGIIPHHFYDVLFVLGSYGKCEASPTEIIPMLCPLHQADLLHCTSWSICAFGRYELPCALAATHLGGGVRLGFENNHLLADGTIADSNATLIKQFKQHLHITTRQPMSSEEYRQHIKTLFT